MLCNFISIIFLFLLLLGHFRVFAQNTIWTKTYGGSRQDGAYSIIKTKDGGLVLTGFSSSFNTNNLNDALLLKIDSSGVQQWMQNFNSGLNDIGFCVRKTMDDGFIIGGMTGSSAQLFNALLVRTDSLGNTIWHRTFNLGDDTRAHSVQQTSDGGFILVGQAWIGSPLFGSYDVYVLKTDSSGHTQWFRTFEYNDNFSPGADVALSVKQLPDKGYIIGGYTNSSVWASYLIRTDSLGNPIWSKVYDTTTVNQCNDVIYTSDGGFLLIGTRFDFDTETDVLLIKTDSLGNPLWQKTYGGFNVDYANSVSQLSDSGFVIVGQTGSFGAGQYDVYVLRTNRIGDTLWTRTFGGGNDDRGFSVEFIENRIYITGWTYSFGEGQSDVYLIKLEEPILSVQDNFTVPKSIVLYQNYPNPFNQKTTIKFSINSSESDLSRKAKVTLKVYDILGREIAILVDDHLKPGNYEVDWNAFNQSSGFYFYRLNVNGFLTAKSMVLLK